MKRILLLPVLLLLLLRLPAQTITAAEYFFNADPGPGNGTAIPVGTAGTTVNFTALLSTASLPAGFHTLAVRTKDNAGLWGLFETRVIYVAASATDAGAVTAAEFFIDADPGAGNGTPVGVGATGNAVNFTALVSTASLAPGFHVLAIRVKDAAGVWSLFENRAFFVSNNTADAAAIAAAEYFVDGDPGAGNATAVSIGTSGSAVNFTALIPTASLATGFHTLAIRTKDASGVWGLFETRAFYISTATANAGIITAAEYFLNVDPGVGNGSPLSVAVPGNTISQSFLAAVPAGTSAGTHVLAIRTRDAAGVWGLFDVKTFTVAGGALPLHWLSFSGRKAGDKTALQWQTANEVNASHFEIERSRNGIDFSTLGKMPARGQSQNDYAFDDAAPLKGLNFYRLKQVDRNGAFAYSSVVKIYFGEAGADGLKLFPQPAQNTLYAVFGGSGANLFVQVYDAAGRTVLSERRPNASTVVLDLKGWAKGTYWIVLSDGLTQQKGRFVKQ